MQILWHKLKKKMFPVSPVCLLLLTHSVYVLVSSFRGLPDKYDDYALYTILLKLLTTGLRSLENLRGLGILCQSFISGRCFVVMYCRLCPSFEMILLSKLSCFFRSTPPLWTGIRDQPPVPSSCAYPCPTDHHGRPSLLARHI